MKPDTNHEGASPDEAFTPSRLRIDLRSGALVRHAEGTFRISEILDFSTVVATNVESGRSKVLRIGELLAVESLPEEAQDVDIGAIAEDDWGVASKRYEAIKPLLESGAQSRHAVESRAAELSINPATLYRWLSRYRNMDAVSGLIPYRRGWKTGNYRINPKAEAVIQEVIKTFYLKPERPSPAKAVREVETRCTARNIEVPSPTAVRARIARIPEYTRLKFRGQAELAKNKFLPVPGKFPGADYALAVVQIDHTPVNVILVDDVHRKPIGQPWITVAIDVFSRMMVGYYLSFDAPSVTSVAMCISHAMLPKEEWLLLHEVEGTWPVWGRPIKVHVDNGPDFRSKSLRASCEQHGIDLEFRPVKVPRYGGHIERLQGTLLREIHDLPGTTFSSLKDRGDYDSEKHAVMTKDEFERLFLDLVCNDYHRRKHSVIGMPPLRKWEYGIFGGAGVPGIGMPPRPADRLTVVLDFLPSIERSIQQDGVTIDNLRYYAEALRPWIGSKDAETGKARKFIFRRDPRDVTTLWFWDPELKQYFKVPLADLSIGPFSIWEHRKAKEELIKLGHDPSDEVAVFKSITARREMIDASSQKTKIARREAQRRSDHARGRTPDSPSGKPAAKGKGIPKSTATPAPAPASSDKAPGGLRASVQATDDIA